MDHYGQGVVGVWGPSKAVWVYGVQINSLVY